MSEPSSISPEDAAWAAGLFEGEGTVSHVGACPGAHVTMTDKEPIEKMFSLFGGYLNGPYKSSRGKKACWRWSIHKWEDVDAFRATICKRLSPRRLAQFAYALAKKPHRLTVIRPGACKSPSYAGYMKHYRTGETPCAPCRDFARAYKKQWYAKEQTI